MTGGSLGEVSLTVNGATSLLRVDPATKLLYVLRNDLHLNGPKFGCGLGECGACMVLVDGVAAQSCVVTLGTAARHAVTTLEGLGPSAATQCGYCLKGMIIAATALLRRNPRPAGAEIRAALRYNLCRCGTHVEIIRAVQRDAGMLA